MFRASSMEYALPSGGTDDRARSLPGHLKGGPTPASVPVTMGMLREVALAPDVAEGAVRVVPGIGLLQKRQHAVLDEAAQCGKLQPLAGHRHLA